MYERVVERVAQIFIFSITFVLKYFYFFSNKILFSSFIFGENS